MHKMTATTVQEINIEDFDYDLPNEKIANFPLAERDASKLLVYQNDIIKEDVYKNIASYIPTKSLFVFNNTKVIHARLLFTKESGSVIEIFVLEPYQQDMATAMLVQQQIKVKCFVGGASKWKQDVVLQKELIIGNTKVQLKAYLLEKEIDNYVVMLEWGTSHVFLEIIDAAGNVPLPPYIKRASEEVDEKRYQTIYAKHEGSVAAPTAGLHFTEAIFKGLLEREIEKEYVTLHVGAGTFKPVNSQKMKDHYMHHEYIDVSMVFINKLIQHQHLVVAVGTTSVRTLESLYWLGVKAYTNQTITVEQMRIEQWDAYQLPKMEPKIALDALSNWMKVNNLQSIVTTTQLMIAPGYTYQITNAIVTNFHQPKSTLLLLVAAATSGKWREIYQYALENDFRFLSYGDGSLLFI